MKVSKWMQLNQNRVVIAVLFSLMVLYVLAYLFVKTGNNLVFQEPVIFENADEIETVLQTAFESERKEGKGLSVVYFWKPYCPCNLGVGPHYTDLVKEYAGKGVDFYIVDLSFGEGSSHGPTGKRLAKNIAISVAPYIQYSPAIAILNPDNTLLYYGPHSLGFVCNAETSIASQVISSFKQGVFSKNINVLGNGCFCGAL